MADRKPIRWAVQQGAESYMGLAQYFLTHEENMRQSFSQPSRRARRTLPDGTTIDYIMNDVVDFIQISPPQGLRRVVGKAMTWDTLPPFIEGTSTIDLSQMTADPDVSGGYYCTVSVINGTDEMGRMLPAEFSVDTEDSGWSIEQIDATSARLKLGADVEGECDIVARDRVTELRVTVAVEEAGMFLEFFVMPNPPYYIKLSDYIAESPVNYVFVTPTDSFLEPAWTGFTIDTVDDGGDGGRPMETRTYTRTLKYLGEALEVCVEVQKWYYAWDGSAWAWVHDYHVFEGRRTHISGFTYDYYLSADNAGTYLTIIESNTRTYLKYPDVAMFSLLGDDYESESTVGGETTYLNNGSFIWSIHYKDEDNYLYIWQKYNSGTSIYSYTFQGKQKGVAFNYERLYETPMPDGNVYIGMGVLA